MECILPVLLFDFRRVILASVTLASKSSGDRMVGRSVRGMAPYLRLFKV